MFSSRAILLAIGIVAFLLTYTTCNAQAANIDEETGCPIGVANVCQYCAVDQNRFGCYCELEGGDEIVTANLNTPCPRPNADPCSNHTCKNGAVCVPEGLTTYKCNCTSGFGGAMCNETLAKCSDANIDCLNAECVETNDPLIPVYCQCFDGTRRDPRQNDTCPPSPCYERDTEEPVCKNNGTCRIYNNAYICECKGGWGGVNCSKALQTPLCQDRPGVCGEGKCQQSISRPFYACSCGNHPSTFANKIEDLVKCEESGCYSSNPCQNGGTCSNKGKGAFICQCPPRFTGTKCEKFSACYNNPCVNNGICEAFNETLYFCKCPAYFTGVRCETPVPDPCKGKQCGPFGECRDSKGSAVCLCSDGYHLDGTPCQDPCRNKTCGLGVCSKKANSTFETVCSCPIDRQGEFCEKSRDICREKPTCGGGYCKPNYSTVRGYTCICEGGAIRNEPCPFSKKCPITDCGSQGICVETDGIILTSGSRPIYNVCSCKNGYISSNNCDAVLVKAASTEVVTQCGPNGKPYPSRNPYNPIGCWCNNGTHIEEITPESPALLCP